jgi:hypothetical protein
LVSQIAEPARAIIAIHFRLLLAGMEERYVSSRIAAEQLELPVLWLTDAGILHQLDESSVLLTAETTFTLLPRAEDAWR